MESKDGKVRFNIKTNLPDTAELLIGLKELKNGDYQGQTKVIVSNGIAQTEWFSNRGKELRNGEYELSISMSMPKLQSEKVQGVVGINGEYMEGDYVEKDNDSYFVSKVTTITLGGGADSKKKASLNDEHKKVVAKLYNELINEYNTQSSNYNELEFGKFRADWNKRRSEAQSKMDKEEALMEYDIAIRDLIYLETELKNKLAGKTVDDNYIKEIMTSIENIIK